MQFFPAPDLDCNEKSSSLPSKSTGFLLETDYFLCVFSMICNPRTCARIHTCVSMYTLYKKICTYTHYTHQYSPEIVRNSPRTKLFHVFT